MADRRKYFALEARASREFGEGVIAKWADFQEAYRRSSLFNTTREALASYFNRDSFTGASRASAGSSAFLRKTRGGNVIADINEYRSLLDQIQLSALKFIKPIQPVPGNTDVAVQRGAEIGRFILESERQRPEVQDQLRQWIQTCLLYGVGWMVDVWDVDSGELVGSDAKERPVYAGNIESRVHNPSDSAWDRGPGSTPDAPKWFMRMLTVSRWDLIAQRPRLKSVLEDMDGRLPSARDDFAQFLEEGGWGPQDDCDTIDVLDFFHAPSPALPEGRYARVLPDGSFLFDFYGEMDGQTLGLPYPRIPAVRLAQDDVQHAHWPYPNTHDLLPTCRLVQAQVGKMATKSVHQTSVIVVPPGATYTPDELRDRAIIRATVEQAPKEVTWGGVSPEDFTLLDTFRALGQSLAVVSSASRGESESGDSGKKSNLLMQQQEAFAAGFGQKVQWSWEKIGAQRLQIFARHATAERVASISGKNLIAESRRFVGEDLHALDQVRTVSDAGGNMELAIRLVELQMIKPGDISTFISVARDGLVGTASEEMVDEQLLIRAENERMTTGDMPDPVVTPGEDHLAHIVSHLKSAATEENRYDREPIERHMTHVMRHLSALRQDDPSFINNIYFLLATGQKPLPPIEVLLAGLPGIGQEGPGPADPGVKGSQSGKGLPKDGAPRQSNMQDQAPPGQAKQAAEPEVAPAPGEV